MPFVQLPVLFATEWWRADRFAAAVLLARPHHVPARAPVRDGGDHRLAREPARSRDGGRARRASEAESLRDQLGRRVDVLDAANRCARALGSSLEIEEAFAAFIRELRGLVPFDRTAIVLADEGAARVIAAAGAGAETVFPPGSRRPVAGSLLEEIRRTGQTVYRRDMTDHEISPKRRSSPSSGCAAAWPRRSSSAHGRSGCSRSSVSSRTPSARTRSSSSRCSAGSSASAVQNIRAYEAERATVEELRRLSALRADFVSMVSHELRSPMAAVIGSANTLHAALARAHARAARVVPRAHRARDEPAGRARRRRARHLTHRVGGLQLQLRRRRRRRARPANPQPPPRAGRTK